MSDVDRTPPPDPSADPTVTGLRFAKVLVWLVYAYFIVALVILVLMFFLQLFNASTAAEFTQWVYRSGDRVLQPFRGIFPTHEVNDQGSVIDFAVLFAIIVYGILALATHTLVDWLDTKALQRKQELRDARRSSLARADTTPPTTQTPPTNLQ
ncbi:MAG TPA: YggT family protein [Acidimicrobiales bacterium]|nr:YggT family protein [Acidimicrobiales bacterium]